LDSQDQKKIKDAKKSKKKKTEKLITTIMVAISTSYFSRNMILFFLVYCLVSGDFLEKVWGRERLVLLYTSVLSSDCSHYLEEYYNRNASKFVAEVAANLNPDWLLDSADPAVAKSVSNPPGSFY
jgi:hypothetical protein